MCSMTMKIGTQEKERTISSEGVRDEAEVQPLKI